MKPTARQRPAAILRQRSPSAGSRARHSSRDFYRTSPNENRPNRCSGSRPVTDELTGIYNRRKLLRILDDEFRRSRRYGAPLCACMIDLDDFKSVNDRFGHNIGDKTLKALAEV